MTFAPLNSSEQAILDTLVLYARSDEAIPDQLAVDFMAVLRAHVEDMDIWNSDWEELRSVITFAAAVSPDALFGVTADSLFGDESDTEILEAFSRAYKHWEEEPSKYCIGVRIQSSSGLDAWIGLDSLETDEYAVACAGMTPLDIENQLRARGDVFPHAGDLPSGINDTFTNEQILEGVKAHLALDRTA